MGDELKNNENEITSTQTKKEMKNKRNFLKKVTRVTLKLFLVLIIFFVILSSTCLLLFQTQGFRHWISGIALNLINKELEGKLYFSDITINPFKGAIVIKDVVLTASGDTLVKCGTVLVDFKVRPLFNENVFVKRILLEKPVIKLLRRHSDSSWNFEHFAKPSTDTSKSNSKWVIDIKKFGIENATLLLFDSTVAYTKSEKVSYSNFNLKDLNLTLSALMDLGKSRFIADISELKFTDLNSGFKLNNLAFQAEIDTTRVKIPLLVIQTDKSNITLSAQMDSVNFLGNVGDKELFNAPLYLKLDAEPIFGDELIRLSPIPIKISGLVKLNSEFSGNLKNIGINFLKLSFKNSELAFRGSLKNLDDSKNLKYAANFQKSKINRAGLMELLPELNTSGIPSFEDLIINNLTAEGWQDSIFCRLDIESSIGNIKGWSGIGFKNNLSYSGEFNTENLDISKFTGNNNLNSNINSSINFIGNGTDLKKNFLNLSINSTNSRFQKFAFNKFILSSYMSKGIINYDTLTIAGIRHYDSTKNVKLNDNESNIYSNGKLDIINNKTPKYDIKFLLEGLNLSQILSNKLAPELLSGTINLKGEGFQLDSINGSLQTDIKECVFSDRALNPFTFNTSITREDKNSRTLKINSDFMNLLLSGNYNFSNLFYVLGRQGEYLSDLIKTKLNAVNSEEHPVITFKKPVEKISAFAPINLNLYADVKDLSLVSVFLKDFRIHSVGSINISLNVNKTESKLRIDSMRINNFEINTHNLDISSKPIFISGLLDMYLQDSIPVLRRCFLGAEALSDVYYNKMLLEKPSVKLLFQEDSARFKIGLGINHIAKIYTKGEILFRPKKFDLKIDTAKFTYLDSLIWTNPVPIIADLNSEGISIIKFLLHRADAESISITGNLIANKFDNINLITKNYPLKDINNFINQDKTKGFIPIKGYVDSLSVLLNGSFDRPTINLTLAANNIYYSDTYIGSLNGDLLHIDSNITGKFTIVNEKIPKSSNVLIVDIKSLPYNLKLGDIQNRFNKVHPLDITATAHKLPLELVSPFVPAIDNLKGYADASLTLGGYTPDNLNYKGNISITESVFRMQANNLYYSARGAISFDTNQIQIKDIILQNDPEDFNGGKALINGTVNLSQFNITDLDIYINSPAIKMLGFASQKVMPSLYGDFVVATGTNPLHFFGSLQEPYMQGDVNILKAELHMPENKNYQVRKSNFIYKEKVYGNKINIVVSEDTTNNKQSNGKDITSSNTNHTNGKTNFADLIDYDLNIRILGNLLVYMDLGILISMVAEIGLKDITQPLRYVMKRGSSEPNLTGDIVVNEGSTLKFYKTFATSGNIYFPTGSVSNPGLDLAAEYAGQSSSGTYKVKMLIKGTKEQPLITFSYSINDIEVSGDSSKIREDALMLILFGKTKDELKSGGGSDYKFGGVASTYASAGLTNLLQSTGFIKSANIDFGENFGTNSLDKATVIFTGQFFGGKWKAGGTVADLSTNYEVSIEYPLSDLLNSNAFNNFILQLSRAINSSATNSINQKEWEVKIKIGKSW